MTDRVRKIYDRLIAREYRNLRSDAEYDFAAEFAAAGLPLETRAGLRLLRLAEAERAVMFPGDRIGFLRTVKRVPPLQTAAEWETIHKTRFVFDGAQVGNISSDYEYTLNVGLETRRAEIVERLKGVQEGGKAFHLLNAMLTSIEAVYVVADKYRAAAERAGARELAAALGNVPRKGAGGFYEALVFFRILNFALWLNGNKHNTVGRFDVYMRPFYDKDIETGKLTRAAALDLLEEFFISLNFDADLYPGVQQGDNGQSLVLGGMGADGGEVFNGLSRLCLEASLELKLIDPKINLRVNKGTPDEVYRLGTELTKQGLGFPQYSNDDVVIPALTRWGYEERDARDYVVAACWEFIIPKVAMDIPNIDALNFPDIANRVIRDKLAAGGNFDEITEGVKAAITADVARIAESVKNIFVEPSPFQSVLMRDCVRDARDVSEGAKYNNYGIHGAGISNAADALAAVQRTVFEDKTAAPDELLAALDADFAGYEKLRGKLLAAPKMGDNDDCADGLGCMLADAFADACAGLKNERGGIFRPGTGTAMYYIWFSERLPATADGRKRGEPFSANYSPSLSARSKGVLSVIQSFTKPDLQRVCNGGPLTLEFHDTVFRNGEGTQKVAALVKAFIARGGHQMQLNAVSRAALLDAQKHPEKHRGLIVRVWGWSGYFNELDIAYQNHIIKRLEFTA
ncbi:MAG: pyruvate formate-lyase [Clostridiales bacterium]|nr:pyruvate formate-lyase [Clostridiales bacterium]